MISNSNIIRIGNSNGVIIPAKLLKALELNEKDSVSISEYHGGILLKKVNPGIKETPFSALDKWNQEHGYSIEDSLEESLSYAAALKEGRTNKDIPEW